MKETLETYRAVTGHTGKNRLVMQSRKNRALAPLLGSFLMLVMCAGGVLLSGCGGGDSSTPSVSQSNAFLGTYAMSVNQNSSGTVATAVLPTGTGTLLASGTNTLDTQFSLADASRSADATQIVTTEAQYGDMTGTFSRDGSFDLTGSVRDYVRTNGLVTSVTTGQTARFQGQLPVSGGTTTVTVTIGIKTTTGTIRFLAVPTPTPTATATPAAL